MQKNIVKKGLVIAVIFLFIAVSFQPVFASDTISSEKASDLKKLLETVIDIANNKEIQRSILKSQISKGLFQNSETKFPLVKNQLRLMFLIGLLLSKSISKSMMQSIAGKYQLDKQETQKKISAIVQNAFKLNIEKNQLQNPECNCEKKNFLDWWPFPIICGITEFMYIIGIIFWVGYWLYGIVLCNYISLFFLRFGSIAVKLECKWPYEGIPPH
jgi:hypothetical protein